ncbi:Adhesion G protein-coupled receptor B3, partial [Varanus komodoensis]
LSLEFGMMGDHTIKSQRPRSVHEKSVPQEQADAAKFMAQTGESGVEEWAQWSSCSVTCGQGSQVRTRTCVSPYGTHCSGPLRESRVCNNTALCPESQYMEFGRSGHLGACAHSHVVEAKELEQGHVSLPSMGEDHVMDLRHSISLAILLFALFEPNKQIHDLTVDGQWQEWSAWSQCSVTCSNGTQQRSRQCTAAAHGGSECRGPWAESRECYNPECTEFAGTCLTITFFQAANGQWNHWGHWSGCSKSCDGGWEKRMRICQGAAVTGQQCEGAGEEVRRCSEQRCPAPYEICPEDYLIAMVWKRTPAGDLAFNRCPLNATGTTSRRCSLSLHGVAFWEQPSFARCISNEYRHLQHSIKEHLAKGQRTLAGEGMSQVTKTLLDLTQRKNFYAGDLLVSVEILRNVTDTFKRASYIPASDGVQNFFQIVSNLLDEENKEKWEDAQQIYPGSIELMQVIEDFIHIVGMGMMDFQNSYLMTGNVVASIQKLPAASVLTDINFPMKGRKGMVDWARNSEDRVVIPKNIFTPMSAELDESTVFVLGAVLYKNLELILPTLRNYTIVNSKIIVVTIRPEPKTSDSFLEIELAHLANQHETLHKEESPTQQQFLNSHETTGCHPLSYALKKSFRAAEAFLQDISGCDWESMIGHGFPAGVPIAKKEKEKVDKIICRIATYDIATYITRMFYGRDMESVSIPYMNELYGIPELNSISEKPSHSSGGQDQGSKGQSPKLPAHFDWIFMTTTLAQGQEALTRQKGNRLVNILLEGEYEDEEFLDREVERQQLSVVQKQEVQQYAEPEEENPERRKNEEGAPWERVTRTEELEGTLHQRKQQNYRAFVVCGNAVDIIYFSFSKAVDKVHQDFLISKLVKSGLVRSMIKWIHSWLQKRTERVLISGICSNCGEGTLNPYCALWDDSKT